MRRTGLGIALACMLYLGATAWATVEYKDVGDLSRQARQIVIGDIVAVTSFIEPPTDFSPSQGLVKSQIVVAVTDYLVGDGRGTEVLEMSGGTVNEVTLHVSVLPVFEVGDHVLLFLGDSEIRLVGSFQGAYLTDGEMIARMAPACGQIMADSLQPLSQFLAEIEDALGIALPEITPYDGDFQLPPGGPRYALCGYDWAYQTDPMGEDYVVNANCEDSSAGDPNSQTQQIQNAADAWTNAGADFAYTYGGASTQTAVDNDGVNLLYFDTTPPDGGDYIASTYIWQSGGNIAECDLVFNDLDYEWWNGDGACSDMMDIWNVAAHEFGHFLCLGHSSFIEATMYESTGYCETWKRTLHSDDINGIIAIYGASGEDNDPPQPDPMTFASAPAPASTTSISMTATTATDDTPPIDYQFDFVTGGTGGTDSAWQGSTTYVDDGLQVNTAYSYRVRARDSAPTPNETAYSSTEATATYIETPAGLFLFPQGPTSVTLFLSSSVTNLTVGSSGLYFDSTTPGGDGGLNEWIQETIDTATDLTPDTIFTFRVKARNQNAVETPWSTTVTYTTPAAVPGAPILSNPGCYTMDLDVDPSNNPSHTVFAIRCADTSPNDNGWDGQYVDPNGLPTEIEVWQTDSEWGTISIQSLQNYTEYTFEVKADNQDPNAPEFGPGATLGTMLFADLSQDEVVGIADLATLLSNYGATTGMGYWDGDLDYDGDIQIADLALLLSVYGDACPQ